MLNEIQSCLRNSCVMVQETAANVLAESSGASDAILEESESVDKNKNVSEANEEDIIPPTPNRPVAQSGTPKNRRMFVTPFKKKPNFTIPC